MYKICKTKESVARQKTLVTGLMNMMLKKRFEDITVSDLCRQMQIPRNTFYRYFPDKEAALLALIDHTLMECNEYEFTNWGGSSRYEQRDMEVFFEFWLKRREFLEAITKNNRVWQVIDRCTWMLNQRKGFGRFSGDLSNFAKEQEEYIFTYGMMTILFRWYYFGFPASPKEMAKVAFELFASSNIVRTNLFL